MRKQQQQHRSFKCISPDQCPGGHGRLTKGYVPVLIGTGKEAALQRFLVSVEVFEHPRFIELLDMAVQEFGYQQKGVLSIPCDPEQFRQVFQLAAAKEAIRIV